MEQQNQVGSETPGEFRPTIYLQPQQAINLNSQNIDIRISDFMNIQGFDQNHQPLVYDQVKIPADKFFERVAQKLGTIHDTSLLPESPRRQLMEAIEAELGSSLSQLPKQPIKDMLDRSLAEVTPDAGQEAVNQLSEAYNMLAERFEMLLGIKEFQKLLAGRFHMDMVHPLPSDENLAEARKVLERYDGLRKEAIGQIPTLASGALDSPETIRQALAETFNMLPWDK